MQSKLFNIDNKLFILLIVISILLFNAIPIWATCSVDTNTEIVLADSFQTAVVSFTTSEPIWEDSVVQFVSDRNVWPNIIDFFYPKLDTVVATGFGSYIAGVQISSKTPGDVIVRVQRYGAPTFDICNDSALIHFVVVDPDSSTIIPRQDTVQVGIHCTLDVFVKDQDGNPIEGIDSSYFHFYIAGNPSGITIYPKWQFDTAADGKYPLEVSCNEVGIRQFGVRIGHPDNEFNWVSVIDLGTIYFSPGPVDTANSFVTIYPTNPTIDDSVDISINARDVFNNIISNANVSMSMVSVDTFSTISWSPADSTTDVNGQCVINVTSHTISTKTFNLYINGLFLTQRSITFTAGVPDPTTATITAFPTTGVIADSVDFTEVIVTLKDRYGNIVTNYPTGSDLQILVFPEDWSNNFITYTSTTTDSLGRMLATVSSIKAEMKDITARFEETMINDSVSVEFIYGPFDPANSTLTTDKPYPLYNITCGDGDSTLLTVNTYDKYNNIVPNVTNISFISSLGSTFDTFIPNTGSTDSLGILTSVMHGTKTGLDTVWATDGTNLFGNYVIVNFIADSLDIYKSSLSVSPDTLEVSAGANQANITLIAKDQFDNPIENISFNDITFNVTGTENAFTPPTYHSTAPTNALGEAYASLSSQLAETKEISVMVLGKALYDTVQVTFIAAGIHPDSSSIIAEPDTLTPNNTSTITITLKDEFGNPKINNTIVLTSLPASPLLNSPASPTDNNGIAIGSLGSAFPNLYNVYAIIGGTTLGPVIVLFKSGVADSINSQVTSSSAVPADSSSIITITVSLVDNGGNPVNTQDHWVRIFSSRNTIDTIDYITQPSERIDVNGRAYAEIVSWEPGQLTVNAEYALDQSGPWVRLEDTAVASFLPLVPSADLSSFTALPVNVIVGDTVTLEVTIKDSNNILLRERIVTFYSDRNDSLDNDTFLASSAVTNNNGFASVQVTSTLKGRSNYTAICEEIELSTNPHTNWSASDVSITLSTMSADPTIVSADGSSYSTISARLVDQYNNILNAGIIVTFTPFRNGLVSDSLDMLLPPPIAVNDSGYALTEIRSMYTGNTQIRASVGVDTLINYANVRFVYPDPVYSQVSASPDTIIASNGEHTSTISIYINDENGAIPNIPAEEFQIIATGTGHTIDGPNAATNGAGFTYATIYGTKAESKIIHISVLGNEIGQVPLTIIPARADTLYSSLIASPDSVLINTNEFATITITAKDEFNNPLEGKTIEINTILVDKIDKMRRKSNKDLVSGDSLYWLADSTNSDGIIQAQLYSTTRGKHQISAIILDDGFETIVPDVDTVMFYYYVEVEYDSCIVDVIPDTIIAGYNALVRVQIIDNYGDNMIGHCIQLITTGGNPTITPDSAIVYTTSEGAIFTITDTLVGTITIGAIDWVTDSTTYTLPQSDILTIIADTVMLANCNLTASPTELMISTADTTRYCNIIVTLRDRYRNIINGELVRFRITNMEGANGILTNPDVYTSGTGIAETNLSSNQMGYVNLTGRLVDERIIGSANIKFTSTVDYSLTEDVVQLPVNPYIPGLHDCATFLIDFAKLDVNNPNDITFKLFALDGSSVATIPVGGIDPNYPNDYYIVKWYGEYDNEAEVPAGVYIFQVESGGKVYNGIIGLAR